MSLREVSRLAYVDCVRGYAVLLVISCHLAYEYVNLPWPVHRLAVLGWHGVQLFFMASALTLLLSWQRERERTGRMNVTAFFVRRFFRIAPAYYTAAAFYYWLTPPAGGLDVVQLLASLAFANGWHPAIMPTTSSGWSVVPGGWSIGVEFSFYAVFPVFVFWVTSLRRWSGLLIASLVIAVVANLVAQSVLLAQYNAVTVDNFLYFWLPNQFPVFVLGAGVFLVLGKDGFARLTPTIKAWSVPLALLAALLFFATAYSGGPLWLGQPSPIPPRFIIASFAFAVFLLAMSVTESRWLINGAIAAMGRVSFSAYLWHFAVLRLLPGAFGNLFHTEATDYGAILAFVCAWPVVVLATFAVSWVTFQAIEQPGIRLGQGFLKRLRA